MLCGADPAGRPTAFCAAAGPGVKPGKTAQDGATKGPPWRFVSGRWEARRHHRQRQGRACPVPIRRAVPLLPVLLPGRTPGREGQPRTERRKGRPCALSVNAGRPVDTTGSGRAGLVRCRSGGQAHCFPCFCRAGRQAGEDSPGRSDERAALALCQWTLGGLPTPQTAAGPGLSGADPAGSPTASCAAAGPGADAGKALQDGAMKGPPWDAVSGRWEACGHNREREGHCCAVPIRRAVPLRSVLLPGRAPGREGQPRRERRKGRPGALSVDAGRPVDTTESGRAIVVRCRSGG